MDEINKALYLILKTTLMNLYIRVTKTEFEKGCLAICNDRVIMPQDAIREPCTYVHLTAMVESRDLCNLEDGFIALATTYKAPIGLCSGWPREVLAQVIADIKDQLIGTPIYVVETIQVHPEFKSYSLILK